MAANEQKNWAYWEKPEDLPTSVRQAMGDQVVLSVVPPDAIQRLEDAAARAASRAITDALERERIRWACWSVQKQCPDVPKRAIFKAVAILLCRAEATVRRYYYDTGGLNDKESA